MGRGVNSRAARLALRGRVASRLLGVVAGLCLVVVAAATPAAAHVGIRRSSPGSGERLAVALTQVQVQLEAGVDPALSVIAVIGPDGRNWADGPLTGSDVLTQPVAGGAPTGRYTASYRIVSADGHVVTGAFRFTSTVAGPAGAAPRELVVKSAGAAAAGSGTPGRAPQSRPLSLVVEVTGGVLIALLLLIRFVARRRPVPLRVGSLDA